MGATFKRWAAALAAWLLADAADTTWFDDLDDDALLYEAA